MNEILASTDRIAYDHYNTHFNNATYAAVQTAVVRDVFGEDTASHPSRLWDALGEEPVHTILNAVTDAVLGISGVRHHANALRSLMILTLQHKLSDGTIQRIAAHLRHFEHPGTTHADDFVSIVAALKQTQTIMQILNQIISHASEIHSWQGRCAYHLLIAAQALTLSASVLLKEDDTAYFHEKLARGIAHITDALNEGKNHSENPTQFSLEGTELSKYNASS